MATRLALEIRVSWGADLLYVRHFSPPRALHVSEALIGSCAALPAEQLLVSVDDDGVRVRVPEAASAIVEGGVGAREEREILLDREARVRVILPPSLSGSVYRARPEAGGGGAPIVIELGLVRADEAPRRAPLAGMARSFVATAAVTAVMAAALGVAEATEPYVDADEPPSVEQRDLMVEALVAVEERAAEAKAAERGSPRWDDEGEMGVAPVRPGPSVGWWSEPALLMPPRDAREDMPLEALVDGDALPFEPFCWSGPYADAGADAWPRDDFPTALEALRQTRFGLRLCGVGEAAAPFGDGLRNRPSALWFAEIAAARRRARAPDRAVGAARVTPLARGGSMWTDAGVERAVRERLRDVRACRALNVQVWDSIDGSLEVRIRVGADGVASNAELVGRAPPFDRQQARCVARALDGLRAPPRRQPGAFDYRIELGKDDARR